MESTVAAAVIADNVEAILWTADGDREDLDWDIRVDAACKPSESCLTIGRLFEFSGRVSTLSKMRKAISG